MNRPKVLVVDDEAALIRALAHVLDGAGFDAVGAESAGVAAQLLANDTFDAVLTDISMPGMDGMALLRTVRERDLEVPVLLMTGHPNVESATEAVRRGASAYLIKPFSSQQLSDAVRRAVALGDLARLKRESIRALGSDRPAAGDRAGLEVTLERALRSIWMAYQPIVDATTRSVFGYEALLRSGEGTLPHPGAVLDAAERLGRLEEVGRAVRNRVPDAIRNATANVLFFVNLHAKDLATEDLGSNEESLTAMASRVVLEVTERASLEGVRNLRSRIARLREAGFRVAIDDLGAGYAGLTSFAELEPEFVKLDMSLVRDVHKSPTKQRIVRSMTSVCKDMGVLVVAEGIEVAEERDTIVDLGCHLLQGYLFAKPGPAFPEARW